MLDSEDQTQLASLDATRRQEILRLYQSWRELFPSQVEPIVRRVFHALIYASITDLGFSLAFLSHLEKLLFGLVVDLAQREFGTGWMGGVRELVEGSSVRSDQRKDIRDKSPELWSMHDLAIVLSVIAARNMDVDKRVAIQLEDPEWHDNLKTVARLRNEFAHGRVFDKTIDDFLEGFRAGEYEISANLVLHALHYYKALLTTGGVL